MASPFIAVLCAGIALLLWMPAGWVIARRLRLGRDLEAAIAPVMGWAVQTVVSLQVSEVAGFASVPILASTIVIILLGFGDKTVGVVQNSARSLPIWVFIVAALVAVVPALAVLPKVTPDEVALAGPIYDHAKIALVDEIVRTGIPPANPFFGQEGSAGSIAYYYLWHFGAAELALLGGATGWEADIAATWFTAFASLVLMCGLAFRIARGNALGSLFVLLAALCGSLRPVLEFAFGAETMGQTLKPASGLAGWLFQSSWSPQHVMSAVAVVLSVLLIHELGRRPSIGLAIVLALVAAAGFESSLWVGGVMFAIAGIAVAIASLPWADPGKRLPFLLSLAVAGCLCLLLVLPLLNEQIASVAGRGGGAPIRIAPYPVLGPAFGGGTLLDLPAYWLVLLPIEFGAVGILGAPALFAGRFDPTHSGLMRCLAVTALAGLVGGWLLVSTVGENNDLGWRAVLPALLILTAFAGACAARSPKTAIVAAVLLALAVPGGVEQIRGNAFGRLSADGARFLDAPGMWAAVRAHTAPDERVASNPLMTRELVPWPIALSWAVLADRRSCYAGNELTLAFAPLSATARHQANSLFERVFAGSATPDDITLLMRDFGCRVVLVTPQDGAWRNDPFADGKLFSLVDEAPGKWRIYRRDP